MNTFFGNDLQHIVTKEGTCVFDPLCDSYFNKQTKELGSIFKSKDGDWHFEALHLHAKVHLSPEPTFLERHSLKRKYLKLLIRKAKAHHQVRKIYPLSERKPLSFGLVDRSEIGVIELNYKIKGEKTCHTEWIMIEEE